MFIDYISNLERAVELCGKFENAIVSIFLTEGRTEETLVPFFVWLKPYGDYFMPVKACVELCRILKPQSFGDSESMFFKAASCLESLNETPNIKELKRHLTIVKLGFRMIKGELSAICSAFDEEEKERMNEAIHNHLEGCNYSCVAMSVSAAESRLLKLMCLASPNSERELEQKTLGQLIFEYDANKEKYRNVVPKKHEPLLDLCNTYRTFSVHPKKQKIKPMIASSILNLTIEFLTDQDTKPEVVQAQLIAGGEGN